MSRRRLIKTLLVVVPLGCLVVGGVLIARAANSPAEGVIKTSHVVASTEPQPPVSVHGKTVSFQYSSVFHQTKADVLSSGDVEKFSFVNPAITPQDLSIQVRKLPSGQLADDGSYNLRRQHPAQYSEQKVTINAVPVSIMSDQAGGFAKVAFLVHGGLVAEIALTSADTASNDQLQAALMTVVQTWHWL